MTDVIIIGGGMAGMTAAIRAAENGKRVLLLERLNMLGKKVSVTGNGRCNLMNTGIPVYYGDPAFAGKVLQNFDAGKQTGFWKAHGLLLRTETENRVYPVTGLASTVMEVLKAALRRNQVRVLLNSEARKIRFLDPGFEVTVSGGEKYTSAKLILACGGAAAPRHGGSAAGYMLAEQLGLPLVSPKAALVSMIAEAKAIRGLSGIRVRGKVSLHSREGESLHETEGEVLFTEDGVSGICVMQCARFCRDGAVLQIRPAFGDPLDVQALQERQRLFGADEIPALLTGLFPPKLSFAVCKQAGIEMKNRRAADPDDRELERIASAALCIRIPIIGVHGMDQAQVTAGGVACGNVDPHTLAYSPIPGLYLAGEMLNVDGDCGGFNLMFAVASGCLSGSDI